MNSFDRQESINHIYKKYSKSSPIIVIGLTIITLGLYVINWIYLRNKEFEHLDEHAPDSSRGLALMVFLPFGWGLIMYVSKALIFTGVPLLLGVMEIVIWGLIIFLLVNYIFDFCQSFGRISKTGTMIWFFLFLLGFVGIISTLMGFYYLAPMIFFPMINIAAMQAQLCALVKPIKKHKRERGRRQSSILSVH